MASLCKNCSGILNFDPVKNALVCKTCGSTFSADEVSDYSEELLSDIHAFRKSDVAASFYDAKIYVCNHCGAEVIVHSAESSTFCVYCGNPAIVFSRISRQIRPDGLIPFKITKEQAVENVKEQFAGASYIPKELKDLQPDKVRGIYVPYWIVNGSFHDAIVTESSTMVSNGKNTHKEYVHYGISGRSDVRKVMVDASRRLDNEMAYRLEPFRLEDIVDFDPDYLAGFYSNVSDISLKELRQAASDRCDMAFREKAKENIPENEYRVLRSSPSFDLADDPVYALFPVWCFTYVYDSIPHTILVNGQTGKVVGAVPVDRKKVTARIVMWTAGISTLIIAVTLFLFLTIFLAPVPFYYLVPFYSITVMYYLKDRKGIKYKVNALKDSLRMTRSQQTAEFIRKRTEV